MRSSRSTLQTAYDGTPQLEPTTRIRSDGTIDLNERNCYSPLRYGFPTWKKWLILSVIFLVQVSMNLNISLYSNAVGGISEEFNISEQNSRYRAMILLIFYAFGCGLWAPWSEKLGREPILRSPG